MKRFTLTQLMAGVVAGAGLLLLIGATTLPVTPLTLNFLQTKTQADARAVLGVVDNAATLGNNSVGTAAIVDGAVTGAKLATGVLNANQFTKDSTGKISVKSASLLTNAVLYGTPVGLGTGLTNDTGARLVGLDEKIAATNTADGIVVGSIKLGSADPITTWPTGGGGSIDTYSLSSGTNSFAGDGSGLKLTNNVLRGQIKVDAIAGTTNGIQLMDDLTWSDGTHKGTILHPEWHDFNENILYFNPNSDFNAYGIDLPQDELSLIKFPDAVIQPRFNITFLSAGGAGINANNRIGWGFSSTNATVGLLTNYWDADLGQVILEAPTDWAFTDTSNVVTFGTSYVTNVYHAKQIQIVSSNDIAMATTFLSVDTDDISIGHTIGHTFRIRGRDNRIEMFGNGENSYGISALSDGSLAGYFAGDTTVPLWSFDAGGNFFCIGNFYIKDPFSATQLAGIDNTGVHWGNGIGTYGTDTLTITSTGITNSLTVNVQVLGFTGTSVTFKDNTRATANNISLGNVTTPQTIILQPGGALDGAACAAAGIKAF